MLDVYLCYKTMAGGCRRFANVIKHRTVII